ncbi:MAG: K(+)-transporting ATPase subunit C [Saprospiraceae bacterium]|nr:K(+)-transporting ATPase subunit C [Saprospiraceae bacterium]
MKSHLLPAIRLTFVSLVFFSGIYTLAIWGIAWFAPGHGNGKLLEYNGSIYYTNAGQNFYSDHYFNSRPSAVSYNAAGSGGSNKGPSNPEYLALVQSRIDTFLAHNPGVSMSEIPADLVTASGSGLDPHISPAAAMVQVARIAKARNIDETHLRELVAAHTEKPLWGFFGPKRIHVLKLNIALDQIK